MLVVSLSLSVCTVVIVSSKI